MKTATYNVSALVLSDFLVYLLSQGLKSTVVAKQGHDFTIDIAYTEEQVAIMEEIQLLHDLFLLYVMKTYYPVAMPTDKEIQMDTILQTAMQRKNLVPKYSTMFMH